MRGFSSVGLVRPKEPKNVGSVLRAAHVYNSAMVAIEGDRTNIKQCTDTTKAWRHIPVLRGDNIFDLIPYDAIPIAVDLVEGAIQLPKFNHPERAFYIFGPEDGTLSEKYLSKCKFKIMIPTKFCMNLAATVNVVLYDRLAKQ